VQQRQHGQQPRGTGRGGVGGRVGPPAKGQTAEPRTERSPRHGLAPIPNPSAGGRRDSGRTAGRGVGGGGARSVPIVRGQNQEEPVVPEPGAQKGGHR